LKESYVYAAFCLYAKNFFFIGKIKATVKYIRRYKKEETHETTFF